MHCFFDPDEYETVHTFSDHGSFGASCAISHRRRAPGDIARIKAERQRKEEDEILRRAEEILARRPCSDRHYVGEE